MPRRRGRALKGLRGTTEEHRAKASEYLGIARKLFGQSRRVDALLYAGIAYSEARWSDDYHLLRETSDFLDDVRRECLHGRTEGISHELPMQPSPYPIGDAGRIIPYGVPGAMGIEDSSPRRKSVARMRLAKKACRNRDGSFRKCRR